MQLGDLLRRMLSRRASDLFITVGVPPSMKVDGRIESLPMPALGAEDTQIAVYGLLNESQRQEFMQTRECNFALAVEGGRFRVNVFQQQSHIGMVIRRIETRIPTLDELKLPFRLSELAMASRGLILVVGQTGSGKSTTLAAMIGHRNRYGSGHVVSVEDPIEYVHSPINCIITQREVGIDTDTYESALKNAMRQAPDVVLVGEIRSREAMEHALTFSETGHLCMATLHANNAVQALERIVNFFPRDRRDQLLMDVGFNLRAIIAQRLVPTTLGGRRAALEILLNGPLIADLLHRGDLYLVRDLMKRGAEQGMMTFDQAVYKLYAEGSISYESALQYAESPSEVRLMIKLSSGATPEQLSPALDLAGLAPVLVEDHQIQPPRFIGPRVEE